MHCPYEHGPNLNDINYFCKNKRDIRFYFYGKIGNKTNYGPNFD